MKYKHKLTTNVVRCKGVSGIYKDKEITIHIGQTGMECKVMVGKIDISQHVSGCWIKMLPDKLTTVTLEMVKLT